MQQQAGNDPRVDHALERRAGCPKRMVFGPCGGVRPGGRCEVDARPCPFVETPPPRWPSSAGSPSTIVTAPPAARPEPLGTGGTPLVVCDVRPAEPTRASAIACARLHRDWCDVALLGEHHDRVDLPNVTLAPILLDEGCRPWVTVTCRDRNGVALEGDLAALADAGVQEVHCVTGDARAAHVRPHTTPVFDLDSLRLAALARAFGLTVSVAESPTVEPIDGRADRAADKCAAGATWCFVNLGPSPAEVAAFIQRSRRVGSTLRHLVCVPVFTDAASAERLAALPGVGIEASAVERVVGSTDPRSAGIELAAERARAFLEIDGVDGVDLSGPGSSEGPVDRAAVMRAVAERIRSSTIAVAGSEGRRP